MKKLIQIFQIISIASILITTSYLMTSCLGDEISNCPREDTGAGFQVDCFSNPSNAPIVGGTTGGTFDVDKFKGLINASLLNTLGFQLAIGYQGEIVSTLSSGVARKDEDCYLEMNDCNIFNIASQTKTITAAAVLNLLEENNLDTDDFISPYLPSDWVISDYVQSLRFRHFLSHYTALPTLNTVDSEDTDWAAVKEYVTELAPVDTLIVDSNPDNNVWNYGNVNYGTMRIIIPILWSNLPDAPSDLKNAPAMTKELSEKYYEEYIRQQILIPAGVVDASLKAPSGDEATLYYKTADYDDEENGSLYGDDWTSYTGGGGWFMSASDLARVIMAIHTNDNVLSPENRTLMQGHPTLGWRTGYISRANTSRGRVDGHGGDIFKMHGSYATFPEGFYAVLMVNSYINGDEDKSSNDLFNYLVNSYGECW